MEDILQIYYLEQPKKWYNYLPLVEFAYNNTFHSSIGMTPFSTLYDQEVVSPITWYDPVSWVEVSKQMLETMEAQTKRDQHNLRIVQSRHKSYVDKGIIHREFQEGDQV